jgi:hypothetical protein
MTQMSKNRIPIIEFDELETYPSRRKKLTPPSPPKQPEDINDCVIRIYDTPDLASELEKMGVNIRLIANLIAEAKYRESEWDDANREKEILRRPKPMMPAKYRLMIVWLHCLSGLKKSKIQRVIKSLDWRGGPLEKKPRGRVPMFSPICVIRT